MATCASMQVATPAKRITLATIKSFLRRNQGQVHIKLLSHFDGMTDGTRDVERPAFVLAAPTERSPQYTLGLAAAWFVGGSRDSYSAYEDDTYQGYEVWNCCVHFIIAVKK